MYKLHTEQDSKAQRMALTAAIDTVTLIQFIEYAYTNAHVTYTNHKNNKRKNKIQNKITMTEQ